MKDGEEIVAVCRWNILENKALCLDLYIDIAYRKKDIMRQMLRKGLWLFPQVKFLGWERGKREFDKGIRYYPVEQFLRHKG